MVPAKRVAFILKGYPRLSETFIAQEILALERRGLEIEIVSLCHPTDKATHPVHNEIAAPVTYLPEYLHHEPLRVWRAWCRARRLPGYTRAWRQWRADLARDLTRNRVRRFGQACVLATEIAPRVRQLHAHFLHTPASVARYAAMMTSLDWTGSAHAKDIYTSPDWELSEKLGDCSWLVTCTATNRDHLDRLAPDGRVGLVYHGLDLARWPEPPAQLSVRDGSRADDPVRLVSVGRAVEKKGYDVLIDALARLPSTLHWNLTHIGGGPLRDTLEARAGAAGLSERITWLGAKPQTDVLEAYRNADLFVLASKIADDGDRDGLPNVMMEAQSQNLPIAATRVSAVPELIDDGEQGLLAEPGDPVELALNLERLIREPDLRRTLGVAGGSRVRSTFAMDTGIDDLAVRFGLQEGA
ncbi:MAG: glycosyltransferase family 4 protein [Alphaproteobacteria bacterium]|nr:glycosyltransferase family 4 protein [Alphaproteobacteria bacterium]